MWRAAARVEERLMSARTVVGLSAMGVTVGLLIPVSEGMAQPRVVLAAEGLGANKAA